MQKKGFFCALCNESTYGLIGHKSTEMLHKSKVNIKSLRGNQQTTDYAVIALEYSKKEGTLLVGSIAASSTSINDNNAQLL